MRAAEDDPETHVIVVEGCPEGKGFCGGYDLTMFGSGFGDHPCQQERHPWDPMEVLPGAPSTRRLHGMQMQHTVTCTQAHTHSEINAFAFPLSHARMHALVSLHGTPLRLLLLPSSPSHPPPPTGLQVHEVVHGQLHDPVQVQQAHHR